MKRMASAVGATLIALACVSGLAGAQDANAPPLAAPAAPPLSAKPAAAIGPEQTFLIGVVRQLPEPPPWIAPLQMPPDDLGIAGAELGIRDNLTSGRFLKLDYKLTSEIVPTDGDPLPAVQKLVEAGDRFILLDVPPDALLKIADAYKDRDVVFINVGATDDRLRQQDCRANVFHIAPSRSMLTDALAQFLVTKRWQNWFLMVGRTDNDKLYAEAVRRSAKKFGAKIVAEKTWDYGPDARATAQSEVPRGTQIGEYDLLIVADELGEFGDILPYNTWLPRPIAGTQGLMALSWHPTMENWGASQLQSRFFKRSKRMMQPLDFQMWQGVFAVGSASLKTRNSGPAKVKAQMLSPDYDLPVFKGVAATFRDWDQQLRQPILLTHATNTVTLSPQAGFLHQSSPLDTLGFDRPESLCKLK
ncbi:ABC transporter substrate-binding protein [Ancylobacter dichloromethanicus]|uniref:ABC transporter substrate-binding protein n=1 Tax=Ancylobacter dichloromethanicus TaxID=518825 RepID=A0A9W6JCW7_9HYPH|nr:ABC transporter substrate-binding protein [Ancylobacter dichloromethanicus]MBS7555193.1 ABC transporter substrate-binding protein [Ancylobacter dichloromethanicus]GLK73694.1 ABC transporter substrate-binding protein [Ancylobacter dichloromethanicus]